MSLVNFKKIRFLGVTPKNIKDESVLDYFLYVFELTWVSPVYEYRNKNIKGYFENRLNEIASKQQLCVEKKWWSLVLLTLSDIAENQGFIYLNETINSLLNKISNLSITDLEDYCNDLAFSLIDETNEILSVRPIEMINLESDASQLDIALDYFVKNKDSFVKIFSKNLNQKDVDQSYISNFSFNPKPFNLKFTTFWNIYFEVFVGYFLSVCTLMETCSEEELKSTNTSKEQIIKETVITFLTDSVQNKLKIDKLNEELLTLMTPQFSIFIQSQEGA